eukprot:TRINITY_DN23053_c0_g1_i3.p1 TRINITY_DN23053_c0_g1~~TRINITY_DN23053_c0_g1_i3.p1  ORF type:complete len:322 (-),score=40.54 TRINITY_DN23053_c0_g1_i3:96-947(-)
MAGSLLELLPREYSRGISLVAFHSAIVPKTLGGEMMKLLQNECPFGPDLLHLKRVRSQPPSPADAGTLEVLICRCEDAVSPPPQVAKFLAARGCEPCRVVEVPRHSPLTRTQLADWSTHWPLNYRKPSFMPLELTDASRRTYLQLLGRATDVGAGQCGCIVLDRHGREVAAASSAVSECHPLQHAVLLALETASAASAQDPKRRRVDEDYLCQDCEVVTTHEPCIMCSMALVHSRVRLVAYRTPDPDFGGLGGKLSLHTCQSLNHQFRVLRWVREGEPPSTAI